VVSFFVPYLSLFELNYYLHVLALLGIGELGIVKCIDRVKLFKILVQTEGEAYPALWQFRFQAHL
jgi:hypothetical protein